MNNLDPGAGSFREGDPPSNPSAPAERCKLCSQGNIVKTRVVEPVELALPEPA